MALIMFTDSKFVRVAFSPRYLLATNTVSCSTLLGIADVAQQYIHGDWDPGKDRPLAIWRTLRFSIMGIVVGPMNHFWYKWLDASVIRGNQGSIVLKKVIADLAVSPVFASTFVSGLIIFPCCTTRRSIGEEGAFRISTQISTNFH
ncbi:unnamed protein product, partial [Anisakis simplex]|uniref:Mpv17-like protein 2 (inferred by orthology to a human protein) n=1 Tax=Anisakis simplex TaxID=6269 RepID=A0A0M3KBP6_ANISI